MKVLETRDLRDKGIHWTRQHLYRLVRQGRFPRPFRLGNRTNAWTENEIDEYLKKRIAMRDAEGSGTRRVPDSETAQPA
jgi:prophage regulatory protein